MIIEHIVTQEIEDEEYRFIFEVDIVKDRTYGQDADGRRGICIQYINDWELIALETRLFDKWISLNPDGWDEEATEIMDNVCVDELEGY